jgi:light-regulated signal transduction histidine kinase (bacteriophytochrome)
MVAAFFLTAIGMTLLVWVLVIRPLGILSASSRRIAEGEFDHPISQNGPRDIRAVARDVDLMRHRIMEELDASREQEQRLTELAAGLDAQALELRRSNAELEQFAYVASHDLQEPLRKVASFCQLLEKRYGDSLDERGQQYIDFAVDGAKRMQVLITDLLTFSRVGRVNDARETVALDTALDKALTNLATAVEESGTRIDRPERLPAIEGDPTLLSMLWQNLVGNAIKFRSPDRAPVVTISCVPDPEAPEDGWQLSVADNGIGIPPEFAEKVFVIFQRLHSRDSYSGTGIGLALCKKIVDHHGGRIWIDTSYAGGTRICFTLPSQPVAVPAAPAAVPAQEGTRT